MVRPITVVATTHKITGLGQMADMAALRLSETTFPLCHLALPHKPLHMASSMALPRASNKVRLEVVNTEATAMNVVVVAVDLDRTHVEGMVRVEEVMAATNKGTARVGTVATSKVVDMGAGMVAVEAKEEGTRESFQSKGATAIDKACHTEAGVNIKLHYPATNIIF